VYTSESGKQQNVTVDQEGRWSDFLTLFEKSYIFNGGQAVAQWLRHCATNRKVAESIPDGFNDIFHGHNPSGRTMVLGLTQSLTEMSTRNIS
jgi:hypothetical protein